VPEGSRLPAPGFILARVLAWIATAAGLTLIVVLVTGGFRFEIGPLRLSAHGIVQPLVLMTLAAVALAWRGAARARDALTGITTSITTHAPAAAIVSAAAIAGVGIGFGTFAASAADPAAYVSHSALIDEGRLTIEAPLARAVDWHEATWTFTPLGYRPGRTPGTIVPGYPLGLPLVMAAARRLVGEIGPFLVGPALAALAVLATFAIGARFASPRAGVIAAVLLASSPIVQVQTVQPMSDVPAMAWWTLAVACAARRTLLSSSIAGLLAGLALLTRPNLAPLAALVAPVALGWPRTTTAARFHVGRVGLYLAGLAPGVLGLAAMQWLLHGSPFRSGYGDISDFFAVANIWPNVGDYARRLLTGEGPALTLAAAAIVTLTLSRVWPPGVAALVKLAGVSAAFVLALYLPYGVFPDWAYLRFLLPALPLAFAAIGGLVSEALDRVALPARGVALLAALTLLVSVNVSHAAQQSAYVLRDYEARYRTIGRYLAASSPADRVIVTSQQSGSAHFYTGLPILRWDLLAVDLETAIARLRALGKHPILVVEDWERPALRERFPSGPTASLDWPARAEAGRTTRVGVWDPGDRDAPAAPIVTDRLP
jgi:hypothetical protein